MVKRKTHKEYIAEVANINPNIEVVEAYISAKTKILHRCKIDGHEWNVAPTNILTGKGCPICAGNVKRTHDKYIDEVAKIHPNIEVVETYIDARTSILHKCKLDGYEWLAMPTTILKGHGCSRCAGHEKYSHEEYVERLAKVNPNIEVVDTYINARTKVLHRCKIDGYEWLCEPYRLLSKHGCPRCSKKERYTQEGYVNRVSAINPDIEVIGGYVNAKTSILHRCKICQHEWMVSPTSIIGGHGCPNCKVSLGERDISIYLTRNNIKYIQQYKFDDCYNKRPLSFDFYLPDYNMCIEYDGEQHYKPIEWFGGKEKLEYIKHRDKIKNKYCHDNNILLLRIRYDENIEDVLNKFFNTINQNTLRE